MKKALFERKFDKIKEIKNEQLFNEKLLPDIKKGLIFPAIRKGNIEFYYKGGVLFNYNRHTFTTNKKYAAAFPSGTKNYINEEELKRLDVIRGFIEGYEIIKENCRTYNLNNERFYVSKLYEKYSFIKGGEIVVLDIEISFKSKNKQAEQGSKKENHHDTVDILLYDTKKRKLKFVEAKLFENPELWTENGKRDIKKQIAEYDKKVDNNRGIILTAYTNCVSILNDLFDLKLEKPKEVLKGTGLYILRFDAEQKPSIVKRISEKFDSAGIQAYSLGNPSQISIKSLWGTVTKCN